MSETQHRLVLIVSILAAFVAFLDSSVVNVALPAVVRELGGGLATQQWVVDAYLLSLGSLILIAGSLSDLFGRKRILVAGLVGFGVASLLCALAPTAEALIAARALQGVAGALLVPSSLALIIASFKGAEQGKAIGTWTAWTGISFIVGPLVGGLLVDSASWRWVFAINVAPIALTLWLMSRLELAEIVRERTRVDVWGAVLCTLGLAGPVFGLIEQPHLGWTDWRVMGPAVVGLALLGLFVWYERRTKQPMLPLELFAVRNFSVGNVATLAIYAGLAIATFVVVIFLQQVAGYSALAAGLALLPVTLIMFVLSPRIGAAAGRLGPRWFMAGGPVIAGLGLLWLLRSGPTASYWTEVLPAVVGLGVGLAVTVAPLTAAILGGIDAKHAGVGSAINNAVARIAGLVATAGIGVVVGGQLTMTTFRYGVVVMAGLLLVGGVISAMGIENRPVPTGG